MADATVSIFIPCYNYGRYLAEAIESALAQTRRADEILVIDDGSTDGSLGIARGYEREGVRVVTQPNRGVVPTMIRAMSDTRGDYVGPLSADDRLHPRYVELMAAALDADPRAGFVYPQMRKFGLEESIYESRPWDPVLLVLRGNYISGGSLMRRTAYEDTPGFRDLPALEDYDLWLSFLEAGHYGVLVPEPLYEWRQHGTSRNPKHDEAAAAAIDLVRTYHRRLRLRYRILRRLGIVKLVKA